MTTRRNLTILAIALFSMHLGLSPVFAATTPTPAPTAVTSAAVTDAEIEREKQITKELSLNMPDQTDDPNYPITFVDPSKQGVDITVDDKTITKAPNPYLLPNLAIGEHRLIFKFKTKDGIVRVLTKKLLVTPKPPQFDQTLKTEVIRPNSVTLKGTALPQSIVMIVLNSEKTYKISATPEGKWEFIVPDPAEGVNNVLAFAIKNGVVSTASKSFSVVYKLNAANQIPDEPTANPQSQILDMVNTLWANIQTNQQERPTIFYGVIGAAILVVLLLVDLRLRKRAAKNRDEKTIATLFGNMQKDGGTILDAIQSSIGGKKGKTEEQPKAAPTTSKKVKKAFDTLKTELADDEEDEIELTPAESESTSENAKDISPETEQAEITSETPKAEPVEPVEEPLEKEPQVQLPEKPVTVTAPAKKSKRKAKAIKSKPLVAEEPAPVQAEPETEEIDVTEEPEKKVLTKEEFLKQFQKAPEQDE